MGLCWREGRGFCWLSSDGQLYVVTAALGSRPVTAQCQEQPVLLYWGRVPQSLSCPGQPGSGVASCY